MKDRLMRCYKKYKELADYIIAGGLTTVVSLVLFYGSIGTFLDSENAVQLQAANIFSWCGAVIFAYVVNRIFVFGSSNPRVWKEFLSFAASRVLTLLLDMAVMFLAVTVAGIPSHVAKLISMVLVTAGNYVISKYLIF